MRLVAFLLAVTFASFAAAAAPPTPAEVPFAVVAHDTVISVIAENDPWMSVCIQRLAKTHAVRLQETGKALLVYPTRWALTPDSLLFHPRTELDYPSAVSGYGDPYFLCLDRLIDSFDGGETHLPEHTSRYRAIDSPLGNLQLSAKHSYRFDVQLHYDTFAEADGSLWMYVVTDAGGFSGGMTDEDVKTPRWETRAFRLDYTRDPKTRKVKVPKWVPGRRYAPTIREHFRVVPVGGRHYFLTASGKLYAAGTKPDKDGLFPFEEVWTDPARRIETAILHADGKRQFAFCRGPKPSYFQVTLKPKAVEYPAENRPDRDEEPFARLVAFARLLKARDLLRDPDPDPEPPRRKP